VADAPHHLLHVFPTFAVGGPQVRACALIGRFDGRYRHTVVALDGRTGARALLDPAAAVTVAAGPDAAGPLPARVRRLRRWLRDLRPDLLLTYNWGAIEVALANRIAPLCPHLHHEDGFGPDEVNGHKARRVWLRRLVLPGAAAVIVPSLTLRRIATEVWGLPADRVVHVPNGIDLAPFGRPPAPGVIPGLEESGRPVVGAVGGLRPEKNPRRLVRAFAAAPACRTGTLVLVGDGPERGAVEAEIEAYGVRGRALLPGHLPEPARCLGLFDVFALSSDTEQMPISLIEAMAAGLPAAGTDVGDVRAMVADANRPFIVAAGDGHGLAMALHALAGDADLRQRLGEANRAKARAEYGVDAMVAGYARLIEAALAPSPRRR
jgi:L-malate glycosyltransferase